MVSGCLFFVGPVVWRGNRRLGMWVPKNGIFDFGGLEIVGMGSARRSELWGGISPVLLFVALACPSLVCGEDLFRRGDANADGYFDISDAVHISRWVFQGEPGTPPICYYFNLADVNNDGRIDIADPIHLFLHLFSGGPEPPAPFPDCGPHPGGGRSDLRLSRLQRPGAISRRLQFRSRYYPGVGRNLRRA